MRETNVVIISTILLVLTQASVSQTTANGNDATYTAFLNCLQSNRAPNPELSNSLYSPSNASFTSVLRAYIRNARFNTSTTTKPVLIFTASNDDDVMTATLCAKTVGLQLRIRSGGHDYAGVSYVSDTNRPFMVLDLFRLRSITINNTDSTAWVDAGATLGELYYAIWRANKTLAFPAGVCPTVAAGGHISGGGYGNLLRRFGLAVDNVLDARIVDSNGNNYDGVSAGKDVFWAIKGGGGSSFGVILKYKIRLVSVPETVTVFRVERYLDQSNQSMTDTVFEWQRVAPTIDDGLFIRMLLQPVSSRVRRGQRTVRATFIAMFLGDADRLFRLVNKQFPILGLARTDCLEMSWIQSVLWWGNFESTDAPEVLLDRNLDDANFLIRKSDYVQTPIPKAGLESIWTRMVQLGKVGLVFNPYGGRMDRISPSATPFPHRKGNLYKIQYSINWDETSPELDRNYTAQIRNLFDFMTPFVSKNPRSAFLNYRDLDIGVNTFGPNSYEEGKVYGVKYFGNNFERLVRAKMQFDRENYFRFEQSIPVLPSRSTSGVPIRRSSSKVLVSWVVVLMYLLVRGLQIPS